jgi:hypothetical protein
MTATLRTVALAARAVADTGLGQLEHHVRRDQDRQIHPRRAHVTTTFPTQLLDLIPVVAR